MDGSPQRGSLHATTLWHFDAAEWAPSTASITDIYASWRNVRLTPKADIHRARWDVRFVPKADSCSAAKIPYSISSSASDINEAGIVSPSVLAVVRLITNSNLVGA